MASFDNIIKEILDSVKDKSLLPKVNEEIKIMSSIDGIDGKPIIMVFYNIWKSHIGILGNENNINSWTAYAIGLTNKKPTSDNFLPKRRSFARIGFPDIDTDFDYERRSEIYSYLIEKYGQERVGNIGIYQAMKMKSYIRRSVKSLDPTKSFFKYNTSSDISRYVRGEGKISKEWESEANEKADEIVNSLPPQRGAVLKVTDDNGEEHVIKSVKDAYKWCPEFAFYMDQYPDILKHSQYIEGLLSIYSVHPAGVCLCDVPLSDIAPLRQTKIIKENDEGEDAVVYATQYTNEDLETLGLIKFDILAISTLTVVSECLKMIKERYDISIDIKNLDLKDKKTFDLYQSGNLIGVFQAEEPGMQKTFVQVGCDRFEDIIAIIALYRPGPLSSIPSYANRKRKLEPISYYHKSIESYVKPYLESTYGIICYQETLMQICNSLAGFSISDGYGVIKAVGKKNETLLKKYRNNFIQGCCDKNINKDLSAEYWDKFITPFASYGFNKSMLENTSIRTPDGNKELKNFMPGDKVFCINENGEIELTNVVNLHDHGFLDGYRVIFDDNSEVICSIDHKFLTSKGQLPLWHIWRNGLSIYGTHYEEGDSLYESNNMPCKMRSNSIIDKAEKNTSIIMQNMSIFGLEKETIWRDSGSCFKMRNNLCYFINKDSTSKRMSKMPRHQKTKYYKSYENIKQKQSISKNKSYTFRNCKKNIVKTRDFSFSFRNVKKMERIQSGKIQRMYFCGPEKSKSIKNGDVAKKQNQMGISESSLWRSSKTSGFCKRKYMDRSRWVLPFLSSSKISQKKKRYKRFENYSRERRNAEYRGFEKEYNAHKNFYGMFQKFKRRDERGVVFDNGFYAKISETGHLVSRQIIRIQPVGKQRMYDLEVSCSTHNFLLTNGICTSNSHSCAYANLSYITAYLKANFPEVFMCCYLNVESKRSKHERVEQLEQEAERMGIDILPRSINKCKIDYQISAEKDLSSGVYRSSICPSIMCKGLSSAAAESIVKHQKYKDLRDFAAKTEAKSVDKKAIEALYQAGFFDRDKNKKNIVDDFCVIREDLKKALKKGVEDVDIFNM